MSAELIKIYDEIDKVKALFLQKVEKISDRQLNQQPENGGWSAGQVLYHCDLVESATFDTITNNLKKDKVSLESDWKSKLRSSVLVMFLKLPLKFKAPKVVSKVPEKINYDELFKRYKDTTEAFRDVLHHLPKDLEKKLIFNHPSVGLLDIH